MICRALLTLYLMLLFENKSNQIEHFSNLRLYNKIMCLQDIFISTVLTIKEWILYSFKEKQLFTLPTDVRSILLRDE